MPLTPETLPRHELNGLHARVVEAPNADLIGIEGRVVVETANTLHLDCEARRASNDASGPSPRAADSGDSRVRQVPKQGSKFEFAIEDRASGHATDEAADPEKGSGIASELEAGQTATAQDGPALAGRPAGDRETDADVPSGDGVTYVTVDGSRLLSRPAERTETRGNSPWQSD
ncbi:ribonuclease P protein component 1 [Natronoarchaeum mannanilyticum]|uniref:Ribonuclease P protein component 1 n=1 Tax=Natronoarchaeum mannanilyticum TaxID=926360 RepID=A0AAV3TAA5_9EURY